MYREMHDVELPDGGTLRVLEWGDPNGPLAIFHHGTPSSALAIPGGWHSASLSPFRLCSFNRPGYGASSRAPGRTVASAASWSAAIADQFGCERFAVVGTSGGGPHAAATAAALPNRVTALGLNVSLGPFETAKSNIHGLPEDTLAEAAAARAGESTLRSFMSQLGPINSSLEGWIDLLPPSDRAVLRDDQTKFEEERSLIEWSAQGFDGWVDDDLALFGTPWGFDPAEIHVPTWILFGESDVLVSPNHALLWSERIPHAARRGVPGGGHWLRHQEPELLRELFTVVSANDHGRFVGSSW